MSDESDEIKVVITMKGTRGFIGVQAPDCDPAFELFEGDLKVALERVPSLVEEARSRWAEAPRNPKCESQLPSQILPATPPARSAPRGPREGEMPSMF